MRFVSANIQNFKLLKDVRLEFSVERDRPLTVIRAANGSGKTSVLYALLWGLYGPQGLPSGAQEVRLTSSAAPVDVAVEIQVTVEFERVEGMDTTAYTVIRTMLETPKGKDLFVRGPNSLRLYRRTPAGHDPVPNPETVIAKFLPPGLKSVFFTDGDDVQRFISSEGTHGRQKRVHDAIKVLLGLETATGGRVMLAGQEIEKTGVEKRDTATVASIQMVFQNPFDTLNPSHTVGSQIMRTLEKFGIGKSISERRERMFELLDLVKLPRAFEKRMPRQLSGGQKQRIGVARAFAGHPRVVIADEPMSALDVSVQAAVTELLMDIQRNSRTTMVFISHDLSIVRYLSDRVVVMYLGYIVEQGSTDQIFEPPYHPYTEALLSAIPIADPSYTKRRVVLEGDIPSATNPPPGCPFQTRCPRKSQVPGDLCETQLPPLRDMAADHQIRCHLAQEVLDSMGPVIVATTAEKA